MAAEKHEVSISERAPPSLHDASGLVDKAATGNTALQRRRRKAARAVPEPADSNAFEKLKESFAFAHAYLHTWLGDRTEPYHGLSRDGDFAHFIVNPLYEWYGRNKRILTTQPLNSICLDAIGKQKTAGALINCSSYNYAGTYMMSREYEDLQRRCLDNFPIADAGAVSLLHRALEKDIAHHFGADFCATASTGYQANILAMTAILDESWVVILDRKSHSSLFTGSYLAWPGERRKFEHEDMADLEKVLQDVCGRFDNVMVVVEGLYSLDGNMPNLGALYTLKHKHGFILYCDEAHSFLSLGHSGKGCLEMWNDLHPDASLPTDTIDIRTAGISKAILALGGFVCATDRFASRLRVKCQEFRQRGESIATPAMLQGLWALRRPLRLRTSIERLLQIAQFCHHELRRAGISVCGNDFSPILPVHAGRPSKACELSYFLRKHGVVAVPFSKPAVPMWKSRVRIGLSAGFTDRDVTSLLRAIIASCQMVGLCSIRKVPPSDQLSSFHTDRCMLDYTALCAEAQRALKGLHSLLDEQKAALDKYAEPKNSPLENFGGSRGTVLTAGHHTRTQYGLGAGGTRWTMGTYAPHVEVETLIATVNGQPAALTYPDSDTGLMSTVAALCRPTKRSHEHYILTPRDTPPALADGIRAAPTASGTQHLTYMDVDDLVAVVGKLSKAGRGSYVTIFFSACSKANSYKDIASWSRLAPFRAALAGMLILVDDSTGLRDSRIGVTEAVDLKAFAALLDARVLVFGSFYHSLGLNGAYLTGDKAIIAELRYTSRCYVFSAAPPPYMYAMIKTVLLQRLGANVVAE